MKIDRLVSIIMVLLDKKRIGAQELADMFEFLFVRCREWAVALKSCKIIKWIKAFFQRLIFPQS